MSNLDYEFLYEEMLVYFMSNPRALFRNIRKPSVVASWIDDELTIVAPDLTEITKENPLSNTWVLIGETKPKLTRDVIYAKSYFVIEHPYLTLEHGWMWENKMLTPDQFASLVMSVHYPTEKLASILAFAQWLEIDTIENVNKIDSKPPIASKEDTASNTPEEDTTLTASEKDTSPIE